MMAIRNIPDWQNKTAQQCYDYLMESVQIPSGRGRLKHEWVAENISLAVADAVYAAIASVSQPTAARYNVGVGIDTTAATWKQQATAVAQAVPELAPYLSTLKDFEFINTTRWQQLGYNQQPTLSEIEAEHEAATLSEEWATIQNEIINPSADNRSDLIDALRQAADELEGL